MGSDSNNQNKIIDLGNTVKIKLQNGAIKTYTIRTSKETDPENGIISNECPIGRAILGHAIGELVSYQVGEDSFFAQIIEIA